MSYRLLKKVIREIAAGHKTTRPPLANAGPDDPMAFLKFYKDDPNVYVLYSDASSFDRALKDLGKKIYRISDNSNFIYQGNIEGEKDKRYLHIFNIKSNNEDPVQLDSAEHIETIMNNGVSSRKKVEDWQ